MTNGIPLAIDLPVPHLGVPGPRLTGDGIGIDGVWTTEVGHDPYLPLAGIAASTTRIMLGTAIAVALPRSPLVHAQAAWDLQRVSGGRFILGLGAQVKAHNERRYGVAGDHPGARMTEMVAAIREIWGAWQERRKLSFRGEYYTHTLMTPFFDPGPLDLPSPYPPIYLAAVSEPLLRIAARVADGVHLHPLHTRRFLDSVFAPIVEQEAENRSASSPVARAATVMIAMGAHDEEIESQREFFRAQIAFYGSTPAYRHVLDAEGFGDLADELHSLSVAGKWEDMSGKVPDSLLDEVSLAGTWEKIPGLIVERYGARADRIIPYGVPDAEAWNGVAAEVHRASSG